MTTTQMREAIYDLVAYDIIVDQHAKGHPILNADDITDQLLALYQNPLKELLAELPEKETPYFVNPSAPKFTKPVILDTVLEGMESTHLASRNHGFNKCIDQVQALILKKIKNE